MSKKQLSQNADFNVIAAQRDNKKTVVLGAVHRHAKVKVLEANGGFDRKSKPPFSF